MRRLSDTMSIAFDLHPYGPHVHQIRCAADRCDPVVPRYSLPEPSDLSIRHRGRRRQHAGNDRSCTRRQPAAGNRNRSRWCPVTPPIAPGFAVRRNASRSHSAFPSPWKPVTGYGAFHEAPGPGAGRSHGVARRWIWFRLARGGEQEDAAFRASSDPCLSRLFVCPIDACRFLAAPTVSGTFTRSAVCIESALPLPSTSRSLGSSMAAGTRPVRDDAPAD